MIPLGLLSPGEQGEIAQIRTMGSCCGGSCRENEKGGVRLEDMGLRVGKTIEMLSNGGGPILLKVDESRIAVDRGLAMKILVRRQQ